MNGELINYIAFVERKTNDFHTISFWSDSFSNALKKILDDNTFERIDLKNVRSIKIMTKGKNIYVHTPQR
jgi:hypothetical protein